jgi:hypothetical protein
MRATPRSTHGYKAFVALLAAAFVVAVSALGAAAQEEDDPDQETGVECDAWTEDWFLDEFGMEIYLVEAHEPVECTAFGLDPELTASWRVDFYEDLVEFDPPVIEHGDLVETIAETDLAPEPDGTVTFDFVVPEVWGFGWFEGFVAQGDEGEESYLEEFFGIIWEEWVEGAMTCEPDPVPQGDRVTCTAEEMTPGEFSWSVEFFTLREFVLSYFFGYGMDDEEAWLTETGTADEDGIGAFAFDVPTDREIELYVAFAAQEVYDAAYAGEVAPEVVVEGVVEEKEEKETQQAQPTKPATTSKPVAVERPTRVETGAGGAVPADGGPAAAVLAGLALAGGMLALRRRRIGAGE